MELAQRVASKDSTVLILGETGVDKEVVAKYIHSNSKRKNNNYIKINCGAIPVNLLESELFGYVKGAFTGASQTGKIGMFELANEGTIFLAEIGELPLNLQVKLLQVIQDRYEKSRRSSDRRNQQGPGENDRGKNLPQRPVLQA
jgi:transcriptional regulator with PAS, ATPase and Fis domain